MTASAAAAFSNCCVAFLMIALYLPGLLTTLVEPFFLTESSVRITMSCYNSTFGQETAIQPSAYVEDGE